MMKYSCHPERSEGYARQCCHPDEGGYDELFVLLPGRSLAIARDDSNNELCITA